MIFYKYVSLPVFLVALIIGFVFMYITPANSTKVVVYPTPDNLDSIQYKDKSSNCFKANAEEVSCPTDSSKIFDIPLQE